MSRDRVAQEVRDRLGLARRWLVAALPGKHADPRLAKAVKRLWVERTMATPLDTLGGQVRIFEREMEREEPAPIMPAGWPSPAAVEAVFLVADLGLAVPS